MSGSDRRAQVVNAGRVGSAARHAGAQWSVTGERELDLNVVRVPAGSGVGEHRAPLDVVFVVLSGGGELTVDGEPSELGPAVVAFVPKRAARALRAGPEGLIYVTVHRRREGGIEIGGRRRGEAAADARPRGPGPSGATAEDVR